MNVMRAPRKVILSRKQWSSPKSTAKVLQVTVPEQRRAEKAVEEFLVNYKRPLIIRNGKVILVRAKKAAAKKYTPRSVRAR